MGKGERSLLCDPGSELRLGGRECRRAKIILRVNGIEENKKKTSPGGARYMYSYCYLNFAGIHFFGFFVFRFSLSNNHLDF